MSIAGVQSHRITTATTTDVGADSGVGVSAFNGELVGIIYEGGTAGLVSVYDDANDTTNLITAYTPQAGNEGLTLDFHDLHLVRGLTIVTAAATEICVLFRYIGSARA